MKRIFTSATKIVFILVTITACIAFLIEVVRGQITLDPKDFQSLVLVAFTYYFTKPTVPEVKVDETKTPAPMKMTGTDQI